MSEEVKETATPAPELTVNDLAGIKQVIDVASQRGAFKPNEMVAVGTIYSKLEAFLTAVTAAQQEAPKGE
jgi:hypothetical protein